MSWKPVRVYLTLHYNFQVWRLNWGGYLSVGCVLYSRFLRVDQDLFLNLFGRGFAALVPSPDPVWSSG